MRYARNYQLIKFQEINDQHIGVLCFAAYVMFVSNMTSNMTATDSLSLRLEHHDGNNKQNTTMETTQIYNNCHLYCAYFFNQWNFSIVICCQQKYKIVIRASQRNSIYARCGLYIEKHKREHLVLKRMDGNNYINQHKKRFKMVAQERITAWRRY